MAKNIALQQEVAKILFEFCGTSSQPQKNKADFLSIINDYQQAQRQEMFIQSVEKFFTENTHVASIEIDGDEEYDDEGGNIFYANIGKIEFTPTYEAKTQKVAYKAEKQRIRDCLDNAQIATNWLEEDFLKNIIPWKLVANNIAKIRSQVQSVQQLKILSAVDNYEKNLIDKTISKLPEASEKPKPQKL